jgi:hypothetical protein
MREKFYLKRNPFPAGAILAIGSAEPSESGLIFNPQVNKEDIQEYIQKFVITPSISKGSGFGALWSMGTGAPTSEARGYGKSSVGLYVAKEICKDFGRSILEASAINEGPEQPFLLASYATFKKQVDTGFNAIAFRHVEWLAQPQHGWYDESPLQRLRKRIVQSLPTTYKPGSPEEIEAVVAAVRSFRSQDSRLAGSAIGPMDEGLLKALASPDPLDLVSYLKDISQYRMWRNGFVYLDTTLTFAMRAGVTKAILFIDQIEDFASPDTPRNKKLKEIERFRDIVKETCPFNSLAFFIMTMHPRGWTEIKDLWRDARLAGIEPVELHGQRESVVRVKLLREITELKDAMSLFESYLQHQEYRLPSAPSPLHPWKEEAIQQIMVANGGRPGFMLAHARDILDLAAQQNIEVIDLNFVTGTQPKLPAEERTEAKPPGKEELPRELQ